MKAAKPDFYNIPLSVQFNVVGLIAVAGLLLFFTSCKKNPVYTEARFDGNKVRIEVISLPENKPVFYTYHYSGGKGINYFVIKINGEVQSYFDACIKCYPKKLGYRPHNDRLFCRACDVDYSVHDLKDGIGSCYPIKLNGSVDGGFYLIDKNDLLQGVKYF